MASVKIEPLGGFVGAGMAGGKVHSEGVMALVDLSPTDRAQVEALFGAPHSGGGNFSYRLTRDGASGRQSIEVSADVVPAALIASIKTTLD